MVNYKLDLFAIIMFLGVIQGVFLSVFFFSKESRRSPANVFYGLMLLAMTGCIFEIFLMYTGYIINCLYLVDFSEPLAFVIGPAFFLMVKGYIKGHVNKKDYLHFVFPVVYFLLVIPFLISDENTKFNSWISSYNLPLPYRDTHNHDARIFWITDHHTIMTMISSTLYTLAGVYLVVKAFRDKQESFIRTTNPVLVRLRVGALQLLASFILLWVVKFFNPDDTGDHYFAVYIAFVIYYTTFTVIRQSGFFSPAPVAQQKIKTSLVSESQQSALIEKLHDVMKHQKPFLNSNFSLPELAQKLGTTVHILSQTINDGLGKSFFEMTAEYRVEEAKKLLSENKHFKVEEIAEQVGYNSKSSFNTAFKKITGQTPSQFRQ